MSKILNNEIFEKAITDVVTDLSKNMYEISSYSDEEIANLFDLSEEEAVELEKVINDELIAENKVYSNKKTEERLTEIQAEMSTYVNEQIAGSGTLKRKIVADESEVIDEQYLYLILTDADNSVYTQYMLIDGVATALGSTTVDMDGYVKEEELTTTLEDYAKANEVLKADSVVNDLTAPTNDTVLSTQGVIDIVGDVETLSTTSHVVVDAINEVKESIDNLHIELSQADYDALTEDEKMNGKEYRTYDTGHIYKLGIEYGKDAYFTSLAQLGLTAPSTTGEVFVAMPNKSMLMLNVEALEEKDGIMPTITDAPKEYGILTIEKHAPGRHRIEYSSSLGGSTSDVRKWIGSIKGNDGTGLRWIELTGSAKIYTTMAQLGLDGSTATIQDVINAISVGEIALLRSDAFNNNKWQTQCNGIQYGYLKIEKTMNSLCNIELQEVVAPNRRYFGRQAGGQFAEWVSATTTTTTKGIAQNSKYYKIDMTKGNPSWNGIVKFSFNNYQTPTEVTFMITSSEVFYTITEGVNCIKSVTYTINAANVIIGIELNEQVYGTQMVEINGIFGTMNSLTAEQFTGNTSATFKGYDARPITELTDLGLDGSATIQNIMDKMSIGQHCIINTSRFDDKTEVNNIEYGKVEIRRLSSGMWSLWLEDVLHGDVVAHGTCSASKFVGWHYLATKKVADVGFTTINQTNGLTAPTGITMTDGSKVNYCIRNGICYVHIALQISSISAKINSWTAIAELPKSVIEAVGAMNCESNTVPECMPIRVSQAGKLTLMYKGTTTSTSDWWGYSFSYPVAE